MKVSFFGVLGLVFITLKLLEIIQWSWWIVLLPIYGTAFLAVSLIVVGLWLTRDIK